MYRRGGFGTFGGLMKRYRSFGVVFVCIGRVGTRDVGAFFKKDYYCTPLKSSPLSW